MESNDQLHAPVAVPRGRIHWGALYRGAGVGPRAGLNVLKKRETPFSTWRESIQDSSVVQHSLVTMLSELPQLLRKEQEVVQLQVENVYANRLPSAV